MAYYNELFEERADGLLVHVGSCTGSDTPCYFTDIKNRSDWQAALSELASENDFEPHQSGYLFPWKNYKTSDHLIVLRRNRKKFFQFSSGSHQAWISVKEPDVENDHQCYFVPGHRWGGDRQYQKKDMLLLSLPIHPGNNR